MTIEVKTVTDGHVWLDPIPGDFLVTPHNSHQVMAYINDIPTHCAGDCGWEWSQSATPTVLSVSPISGERERSSVLGVGLRANYSRFLRRKYSEVKCKEVCVPK